MKKMILLMLLAGSFGFMGTSCSNKSQTGYFPPQTLNQVNCGYGQTTTFNGVCTPVSVVTPYAYSPGSFLDQNMFVSPGFRAFLKEVGMVCDIGAVTSGWMDCSSWSTGALMIQLYPGQNTATVTIGSFSRANYGVTLPTLGDFFFGGPTAGQPMVNSFKRSFQLSAANWNSSQGFELYGLGPQGTQGWNKKIQIKIPSGSAQDTLLNYQFYYNGILAGSGVLYRCNNMTCI
jgi:hypothetical protein